MAIPRTLSNHSPKFAHILADNVFYMHVAFPRFWSPQVPNPILCHLQVSACGFSHESQQVMTSRGWCCHMPLNVPANKLVLVMLHVLTLPDPDALIPGLRPGSDTLLGLDQAPIPF